jgi:hypothetical protein
MATLSGRLLSGVGGMMRGAIKRFGPEIAIAVVTGLLSNVVTDTFSRGKKKGKGKRKKGK